MQAKVRLESPEAVYEVHATLVADHKAKKQSKNHVDPMITAYSIVYGEIFDEAMASPQILENWIRTSMTWSNLQTNAKLVSGKPFAPDLKSSKITFIPKSETKK